MRRRMTVGLALLLLSTAGIAAQVPVRHREGVVHGFLEVRNAAGARIATGDLFQEVSGSRVTSRLVFRFRDGSLQEDTAVYTENRTFHLISDHLVQKGPAFPQPLDMLVTTATGTAVVRYTDEHGKVKTDSDHFDMPPDLANGLITVMLKNVRPEAAPHSLSLIVPTPSPRLIKLDISVAPDDTFTVAGSSRRATHYVLKVKLGGVAGVVAPIIGKQPPDSHVWISRGDIPAFVKAEQPFFGDGPLWQIVLSSPVWPR